MKHNRVYLLQNLVLNENNPFGMYDTVCKIHGEVDSLGFRSFVKHLKRLYKRSAVTCPPWHLLWDYYCNFREILIPRRSRVIRESVPLRAEPSWKRDWSKSALSGKEYRVDCYRQTEPGLAKDSLVSVPVPAVAWLLIVDSTTISDFGRWTWRDDNPNWNQNMKSIFIIKL